MTHTIVIYDERPDVPVRVFTHPDIYEDAIVHIDKAAHELYKVASRGLKRWPEAESIILQDVDVAHRYAQHIRGKWPEAEPIMLTCPKSASLYAEWVLKERWPEAEPIILTCPKSASLYAVWVLKERWPEAEPIILTNPYASIIYASGVLKHRWLEAEPSISKSIFVYSYCDDFGIKKHNLER